MAQYDDSRNPFSAASGRPEVNSPWGESAPGNAAGRGGLQLPGEAGNGWGGETAPPPSPEARRRNQWRQFQHLTPDFGVASPPPEPVVRPAPRNASLPTFNRGAAPLPQQGSQRAAQVAPQPPLNSPQHPRPNRPAGPPPPSQPGVMPLQMHPHSLHPTALNPGDPRPIPGQGEGARGPIPSNVTPLRPLQRRGAKPMPQRPAPRRPQSDLSGGGMADNAPAPELGALPEGAQPTRRSRVAKAQRRLANPPLPLLYLIRLVILGVGVAAIAGTLLSVLSPSNVASPGSPSPAAQSTARAAGTLVQGSGETVADLRLTSELPRLSGELGQLATLTPGLTPVAFAVDLDSGQYVDLNGAEPVAAASTIKVPILVAFLQQVDAGTLALNQSLMLQEEHLAGGSGTMRGEAVGTEYTALEVATRMIVASDNTATNMMIAALGGTAALNQTFTGWGLEHTLLRNPLPDLDGTNTTSAKDLALIMALIDQGGLLTPRSRDRLFSIMQRTENISLIPSGIGDKSLTAHKTGDIGSLLGDVALVDVPNGKRYTLALLVQRPTNDGRASELIRRMTEVVHTEMAQPVAPVGNPTLAPMGTSPEAESPYTLEEPSSVEPINVNPSQRVPARDEIPPG
ncbi:serine hydrolase [Leptolyngbya sp. KIOST-1]|uniref:serine hydrolase n=1 Tax=Leptolyngbya sp. KIOST-1 TaxID=1229172 RepID=UPI00069115A7|nr:serine hydrolase [Leptolyngbya sp. KIOST-1]